MALLTVNERKAIFKQLGFGDYNEKSIKAFQKQYMLRKSDCDGVYGPNTDNTLRTVFYTLKYTKNFKPEEFRCECGGKYCCGYPDYMKPAELIHIQSIRDHYKRPIIVTCGLRCKTWNSKLGGSIQNSLHMKGLAIDFYQSGVTDTLANRKASIKWIKKQPNHHYTYGNGINSYGSSVSAPYMGNALHTDTNDNVKPSHPEWKEPIKDPIANLANEYAYPTNSDKANYKNGSPTAAYNLGLNKAYPDRSKWGTATRKGASCDVFVGVCVRNSGVDKNFPRGLKEQITYLAKSANFKEVSASTSTAKDGDIIIYTKNSGGGHICIVCGGKIKEAAHESYYPKTTDTLKARLSTSGKNWVKVYRAVEKKEDPKSYKVIDVSDWQSQIDWAKVKADGVVGAIIRYADGNTLDKRFAENMKNAKANGLHVGSYIFSRAKTKAEAEAEATRLFNACKPYSPDMPLYIDLEVSTLSKYANTVAQAFLNKMKALGGRGGVYANLNWWNNYLVDTAKNYSSNPFWIAQYNSTMDYKPASKMGMWQYSSSGKVDGISGKVDMDKCYIPYWETAPKIPEQPQKTEKQKMVENAVAWCKKIAADNRYHYVKWKSKDKQTHLCPICSKVDYAKDPDHFGWNCIGGAFAVWHHGMGLPSKCNCGVIANEVGEKIWSAKTDADALAIARKHVGINDIKVIRNGKNNVPKSQWEPGDICMRFNGEKYIHTYFYMGNGKVFESTGSSGKIPRDNQVRIKDYKNYTARIIVRYIGK